MDENSPFQPLSDPNRMLAMIAAERKARLEAAARNGTFPVASPPDGSRFKPDAQGQGGILDLISRFLRPGQQTTPAAPKFQQKGIEDEVIQK